MCFSTIGFYKYSHTCTLIKICASLISIIHVVVVFFFFKHPSTSARIIFRIIIKVFDVGKHTGYLGYSQHVSPVRVGFVIRELGVLALRQVDNKHCP